MPKPAPVEAPYTKVLDEKTGNEKIMKKLTAVRPAISMHVSAAGTRLEGLY